MKCAVDYGGSFAARVWLAPFLHRRISHPDHQALEHCDDICSLLFSWLFSNSESSGPSEYSQSSFFTNQHSPNRMPIPSTWCRYAVNFRRCSECWSADALPGNTATSFEYRTTFHHILIFVVHSTNRLAGEQFRRI